MAGASTVLLTIIVAAASGFAGYFYGQNVHLAAQLKAATAAPRPPVTGWNLAASSQRIVAEEDPTAQSFGSSHFASTQPAITVRLHTNGAARQNFTAITASSLEQVLDAGSKIFNSHFVRVFG